MERTTNRDSRFAWVLGCCCLSLLLILALVNPVQGAEKHKEYGFQLAKRLYLYNQGRYREAERYLKEALSVKAWRSDEWLLSWPHFSEITTI